MTTRVRSSIYSPGLFCVIRLMIRTIGIFNCCEVPIENSVTRVTVRHHEAWRVMPNSYPSDGIFNLHLTTIKDSFSCIFVLRQLHLDHRRLKFYVLTHINPKNPEYLTAISLLQVRHLIYLFLIILGLQAPVLRLEYVLFYQFYAKITTCFNQEKFGTAPLLYVNVVWRKLPWKWCQKWRQNIKIVILKSCTRVVLHPRPPPMCFYHCTICIFLLYFIM